MIDLVVFWHSVPFYYAQDLNKITNTASAIINGPIAAEVMIITITKIVSMSHNIFSIVFLSIIQKFLRIGGEVLQFILFWVVCRW